MSDIKKTFTPDFPLDSILSRRLFEDWLEDSISQNFFSIRLYSFSNKKGVNPNELLRYRLKTVFKSFPLLFSPKFKI